MPGPERRDAHAGDQSRAADSGAPSRTIGHLSERQLEVLRLLALSYTNDHIAQLKGVSVSTVERWTADVFRALGIPSGDTLNPRVEAVRRFIAASGIPARP